MKTTFEKIKSFKPCEEGCAKFIIYHKPKSLDGEISIRDILKSNGIKDAVWALCAVDNQDKVKLFCADVAESVLYIFENKYPSDDRPRKAIEAARQFVKKEITMVELKKAADEAYNAAHTSCSADDIAAKAAYYAAYATYYTICYTDAYNAYKVADDTIYATCYATDANCKADKWQEIEQLLLKYI